MSHLSSPLQCNDELCVGGNRCIRTCPVETANIAYQDCHGGIKVQADSDECILCGACAQACKHGSRVITDDTARFFADLMAGLPISIVAAPSIRTNLPEWGRVFTWLKSLGVRSFYDVSLGADICVWAHLRLLEESPGPLIGQSCPVVVAYIEKHAHSLIPRLSPVHSPMACTALYMRQQGITGPLAALSPCMAKSAEHQSTGLLRYNVTFAGLAAYLADHHVQLPGGSTPFDHVDAGPGALFPMPGGLSENLRLLSDRPLRVDKAEGHHIFRDLDLYAQTPAEALPDVYDVLSCQSGCLIGTGCRQGQNIFEINRRMADAQAQALQGLEEARARLAHYDQTLDPLVFRRAYVPHPHKHVQPSPEAIEEAFRALGKDTYIKRNFDCGACGSESCLSMARRIALGVNLADNCVVRSRDEATRERARNADYLRLVRNIGDSLFSAVDADASRDLEQSLRLVSEAVGCGATALWRVGGAGDQYDRVSGWYGKVPELARIQGDWPEAWLADLRAGERVRSNVGQDYPGLFSPRVSTLFIVPIHLRGEFWGFVAAVSWDSRRFTEEDASLLEAAGILLISGILERELNRSLVLAREDALAGTRAKSGFLSRMSHEIRTPMNAIIGMTQMGLKADTASRKDYCLEKITGASTHLLGIINDILDMSKIEADKFELSCVPFSFEQMLQGVAGIINFRANEKRQVFTVRLDPRIPALIDSDDQRLSQVITNLLSNAVKFTPEGGQIRLLASLEDVRDGICGIRVDVSDTGIGLSPEEQSRLFTAFEQADGGVSRKYGGTGLGLAISKRIVELMGGTIWVDSVRGEGSTFSFTFRAPGLTETAPAAAPLPEGLRVLAVDDAPDVRAFFAEVGAQFGLAVDTARDGAQALALAAANGPYSLYFIDWMMPGMDGLALAQALRASGDTSPVVLISSADRGEVDEALAALGNGYFLGKPLFPSALLSCVHQALGRTEDAQAEAAEAALPCFPGRRILLAEDIDINREIVLAMLEPTALSVDTAENGRVAVDKFARDPGGYDMIFMDLQMPEMDGYEATRRIRALPVPQAATVPIIAMTANVFQEDVERCLACGMNGHVGKPIHLPDVMDQLTQFLTGPSGR